MIYLDNCATTKPRAEVAEEMMRILSSDFANPSSLHRFGMKAEEEREKARKNVADLLGTSEKNIIFTSGGTESNNLAIQGILEKTVNRNKKILTTKIEHSSVLDQFKHYEQLGYDVKYIPVDRYGHIDEEFLLANVNGAVLLALHHVNNEVGTINDIKSIASRVRQINKDIHIHVDGVQAFGKIPFKVRDYEIDTYSFSSHKIYGPKGVGGLYIKPGTNLRSLFIGGGQEKNLRSGTENMPGIVGFGKAALIMRENFESEYNHAVELKAYAKSRIESEFTDFEFNFDEKSSPYIFNVGFRDIRGEVLLHFLENDEIYISTSSACSSNSGGKSHVLTELGIDNKLLEGSIRFCFSYEITKSDLDIFIEKLKIYINEIRSIMK